MRRTGAKNRSELAAARVAEIDQVVDSLAPFCKARKTPSRTEALFEQLLLSYAALRSRHGTERCVVLLGPATYDRAKESGLLAWLAEQCPNLVFEPPSHQARGVHVSRVLYDELADFPAADERLVGLIEKP